MAKILIADDSAFMRGSMKLIFEKAGHEVVGLAANGREAVELFTKLRPDITTLDILMKEMDGISALKEIIKKGPTAKVIMITAVGMESKQEEARNLGASGYIRKPFRQEDVIKEIERVIKG